MSSDHDLARELAAQAGWRLLGLRTSGLAGQELRAAGDRLSHEFLAAELGRLRPADAVLSEEGADDPARLAAQRVWIVDPLDGTREFGEDGRADWAVHVALWEGGKLTAGAVALPARGQVLSTAEPPAAGTGVADRAGLAGAVGLADAARRVVVSRTRPPEFADRLAQRLGLELVPLGSAGAKAAAVILGEAGAYVHDGGQYEWDSAAPVAVARSAGLHASRLDGSDLEYNKADAWQPDILICREEFAGRLLAAISAVRRRGSG